jgi:hypothetical protein
LGEKIVTMDDEEKEAQYGCCTFQSRRINKNQGPLELSPVYKNNGQISGALIGFMPPFRWLAQMKNTKRLLVVIWLVA